MIRTYFSSNLGKVTIVLTAVAAALYVASQFLSIAILILISAVITFMFQPLVGWFERRDVPRTVSILGIFFSGFGLLSWLIALLLPVFIADLSSLGASIREFPMATRIQDFEQKLHDLIPMIRTGDITSRVQAELSTVITQAVSILSSVASIVTSATIIPFITFFLLKDGPMMGKKFVQLIPNRYFEMGMNVLYKIRMQLKQYIRGVMIEACIVGTLVAIGLSVLGIQNSLLLGVIAAVLNVIPYIGPLISAAVAVIVSLNQFGGFSMVLPVALLFAGIRIADDVILIPFLYSRSVETHPVAVILYIFIGGQLLGVVGMVLAVPVATVIKVIMKETYWGLEHYQLAHQRR